VYLSGGRPAGPVLPAAVAPGARGRVPPAGRRGAAAVPVRRRPPVVVVAAVLLLLLLLLLLVRVVVVVRGPGAGPGPGPASLLPIGRRGVSPPTRRVAERRPAAFVRRRVASAVRRPTTVHHTGGLAHWGPGDAAAAAAAGVRVYHAGRTVVLLRCGSDAFIEVSVEQQNAQQRWSSSSTGASVAVGEPAPCWSVAGGEPAPAGQ